jgi:hypothetical protein
MLLTLIVVVDTLRIGAGESGKSTISKQMKIIHEKGFTHEELTGYVHVIHFNILESMKTLCVAAHRFGFELQEENKVLSHSSMLVIVVLCRLILLSSSSYVVALVLTKSVIIDIGQVFFNVDECH